MRISRAIWSLPCSMASSRRSLVNHCRILLRARGDFTKPSQSRLGAGVRRLGGEHLDDVAVVERGLQRHQPAVDPGADGAVADLGVDRVGEVDRRRAGRQRDHVAARGEDVDLGGVDLEAQRLQELPRVLGLLLPVEQLAHPGHVAAAAVEQRAVGVRAGARRPPCTSSAPRCRTPPGGAWRRCGSAARRACPARPITVVCSDWYMLNFGIATKSLNRPGHRVPPGVDHAERGVAVAVVLDQDADADQVVDVGELAAAHDHLLVDRVVVLGPAGDARP